MAGERRLNFRFLLGPGGLERERALVVGADGAIRDVVAGMPPWDGTLALPGIPNAHSHVFQRALAGYGEARRGADSFWSWRAAMYRLAARIDAGELFAVARYAYGEMLAAGYTSVAEFHYLHHGPDGTRGTEMAEAVLAAARAAGIRLRLLPVLYQRGGFDRPAEAAQARFVHARVEDFAALLARLAAARPGVALHSLRAVPAAAIAPALAAARAVLGTDVPVHVHVAEQRREVEECLAATGATPVELLLASTEVDGRFALVHATQASAAELARVAAAGATVVVCPLTEAYLGDGLFPGRGYLAAGGRLAVGSDADVRLDAIEELRWLEYGQRLADGARARLADSAGLGAALWRRAGDGGAQALALPLGRLEPGRMADFVVLEPGPAALLGHAPEGWLDALLVAGSARDLAAVYVGGQRVVEGGEWAGRAAAAAQFDVAVRRLMEEP